MGEGRVRVDILTPVELLFYGGFFAFFLSKNLKVD